MVGNGSNNATGGNQESRSSSLDVQKEDERIFAVGSRILESTQVAQHLEIHETATSLPRTNMLRKDETTNEQRKHSLLANKKQPLQHSDAGKSTATTEISNTTQDQGTVRSGSSEDDFAGFVAHLIRNSSIENQQAIADAMSMSMASLHPFSQRLSTSPGNAVASAASATSAQNYSRPSTTVKGEKISSRSLFHHQSCLLKSNPAHPTDACVSDSMSSSQAVLSMDLSRETESTFRKRFAASYGRKAKTSSLSQNPEADGSGSNHEESSGSSEPPGQETFPRQLMKILNFSQRSASIFAAIGWMTHGEAFVIKDPNLLTDHVLPQFFVHVSNSADLDSPNSDHSLVSHEQRRKGSKKIKFSSFLRRMHRWGIKQVTHGPDAGAFCHPFFRRDNPEMCLHMTRQNSRPVSPVSEKTSSISSSIQVEHKKRPAVPHSIDSANLSKDVPPRQDANKRQKLFEGGDTAVAKVSRSMHDDVRLHTDDEVDANYDWKVSSYKEESGMERTLSSLTPLPPPRAPQPPHFSAVIHELQNQLMLQEQQLLQALQMNQTCQSSLRLSVGMALPYLPNSNLDSSSNSAAASSDSHTHFLPAGAHIGTVLEGAVRERLTVAPHITASSLPADTIALQTGDRGSLALLPTSQRSSPLSAGEGDRDGGSNSTMIKTSSSSSNASASPEAKQQDVSDRDSGGNQSSNNSVDDNWVNRTVG